MTIPNSSTMTSHEMTISVGNTSPFIAMFPGQGSQFVDMGKELFQNFNYVRLLYEEASDALSLNLSKLCFDSSENELTVTENTQPTLLITSVCAYKTMEKEYGYIPKVFMGHSVGEYSALVAAGAFPLASAIQWVRKRGAAMQTAVPTGHGTMAAILGLEDSQVKDLCELGTELALQRREEGSVQGLEIQAIVEPANFNAPKQVVIAGSKDAVDAATRILRDDIQFACGKSIPLTVSAPFHCRLMAPARTKMAEIFNLTSSKVSITTLVAPYIPNRTGQLTQNSEHSLKLLLEQIDNPVLWRQSILTALNLDIQKAIEFGPGKVLCGLLKRTAQDAGKTCSSHSLNDVESLKELPHYLREKT